MIHNIIEDIRTAAEQGQHRLRIFETDALERVEVLLASAPDLPVVTKIKDLAERIVHQRLEAVTALPIEGYGALNARKAAAAVAELDRIGLVKVRRHERATKNRKTVLTAIDERLAKLTEGPSL